MGELRLNRDFVGLEEHDPARHEISRSYARSVLSAIVLRRGWPPSHRAGVREPWLVFVRQQI